VRKPRSRLGRFEGDCFEGALVESFNDLYEIRLIHGKGPWRNVEYVDWSTLNYVDWFNNRRIHESLDYVPPVEFEAHYYAPNQSDSQSGCVGNDSVARKPVATQNFDTDVDVTRQVLDHLVGKCQQRFNLRCAE
jgi:hypothetical protein